MCIVSAVSRDWVQARPVPWTQVEYLLTSPEEVKRLKQEVEDLKKQLEIARAQDIKDNAPDCHMDDKVNIILGLAKYLGVDMEDIFAGHK